MPFVEEFWNNTTSPYKNWHKKIKWFIIFIKPNKCQKNRKETEMKKNLPVLTCGPAGPARQRRRPPGASRPSVWPARAHGRAATPPACLSSPSSPGCPARRHVPPRTSLALSRVHSLFPLALSLTAERCRRHRPPLP